MKDYLAQAKLTAPTTIHANKVIESEFLGCLRKVVADGNWLDRLKKSLFYGKGNDLDSPLQTVSQLTLSNILPEGYSDHAKVEILHGIVGAITETVELAEALIKALESGEPIDMVNLTEECGDVLWYLACILRHSGKDFPDIMQQNIAKLRQRYPNGFVQYDALNRDLAAERAVLEKDNTADVLSEYSVEIDDDGKDGFRYRIVHKDGRASAWAAYTQLAMLDDVAAATDYYLANGNNIAPMHAVDVMRAISVG